MFRTWLYRDYITLGFALLCWCAAAKAIWSLPTLFSFELSRAEKALQSKSAQLKEKESGIERQRQYKEALLRDARADPDLEVQKKKDSGVIVEAAGWLPFGAAKEKAKEFQARIDQADRLLDSMQQILDKLKRAEEAAKQALETAKQNSKHWIAKLLHLVSIKYFLIMALRMTARFGQFRGWMIDAALLAPRELGPE